MNGWTVVLLLADVAAIVAGVIVVRRAPTSDGIHGLNIRRINLSAIAYTGSLVALIALRTRPLGMYGTLTLIGSAGSVGMALRFGMAMDRPDLAKWRVRAYAGVAVFTVLILATLVASIVDPPGHRPPTMAERDSARFGVDVYDHEKQVPSRVLGHRPVLADADVAGGIAVPVARYALDPDQLTLVVSHDLTCLAAVVLLAPDDGALDVVVVYKPSAITNTGSPWSSPTGTCEPGTTMFTVYTAIEVELPADLTLPSIRDVGSNGPALPASPPP